MKRVWFKKNDGEVTLPVWTSTDGKVDYKALSHHFLLKLETITLNGNVFPLDSTGKSDASWMQIKDALDVKGTEGDPVSVHGNPVSAAEPSELVEQGCKDQALVKQEHTLVKQCEAHYAESTVKLIMPKPLSGEEAEGLWPEACWKSPPSALDIMMCALKKVLLEISPTKAPELPFHEQDPCTAAKLTPAHFKQDPSTAVPLTPLQKFKQRTPFIQMTLVQEYLTVLNSAKREELLQLKGIGPKRAARVLELRKQCLDPFKDLEDLKNIGLGTKELMSEFEKTLI